MSQTSRLSLALLVCGALASPLVQPAQASPAPVRAPVSRITLVDGTADVWLIGPGEDTWHFFGARPAVDVTRAAGEYRARAVTVTLHFLNLRRVRPQDFVVRVSPRPGFAARSSRPGPATGPGRAGCSTAPSSRSAVRT